MSETAPEVTSLRIDQARMLPFYHDLKNEIVEPDKIVVSSQYFWTKWAPRLGPTLTTLVICLRRHCYYNKLTQERRDWCFPEQATLAREIGVESTKTIRAALAHPMAAYFVRREARYVYDPNRGKKIRTSDMYFVAMDDPLIPEDEVLLVARAAERLLQEGRRDELVTPPTAEKRRQVDARPKGKKVRQVPAARIDRQDSAAFSAPEHVHELNSDPEINTNTYDTDTVGDPTADTCDAYEVHTYFRNASASFTVFPDLPLRSRPFWRAVCDEAARRVTSLSDRTLLLGSVLLEREGTCLVVGVAGRAAARRAETRLRTGLLSAARGILGRSVEIRFVSLTESAGPEDE